MGLRTNEQLCVELTDTEIRLFWFIPGKGKSKINMTSVVFETIPLIPGIFEHAIVRQPRQLTQILEQCLVSHGIKGRVKVRIGIPLYNGFIREYVIPWIPKRERIQLLSYLADEEIPIPANERVSDYFIREDNSSQKRLCIILSGIRKSVLLGITTCFEEAGFLIEYIGFSAIAWAKVMDFGERDHTLVITEQAGRLQLILYKGQIPEIIRTIPPRTKSLRGEEVRLEIQRFLAYFSTLNEQVKIERIIGFGGEEAESLGRGICDYFSKERGRELIFQTLEEALQNKQRIGIEPSHRERILTSIGMASYKLTTTFNNFWREENRKRKEQKNVWFAALVFLALSLAGLGFRSYVNENLNILRQEVARIEMAGEHFRQQGNSQGEKARAWSTLVKKPSDIGIELAQLQGLTGKGVQLERLDYKGNVLVIQGNAIEPVLVQEVVSSLQSMGWEKARLTGYRQEQNLSQDQSIKSQRIEFTLTAERTKNREIIQ
jgi:type IV pilus assembly protein PilM